MGFKRSFGSFLLLVLTGLVTPSLFGQTVLNFPRVVSNASLFTGIAVGNPTSSEVSVTFTAFQPDGTTFSGSGIQNPVTLRIPAGGQVAKLSGEIFGPRDFNGWVQATSGTRGLTGFFLNGNWSLTDLDGAGTIAAGAEFVLPFASEDSVTKTEVTIANPNPDTAAATLTLYSTSGSTLATLPITIPARGLVRQTLKGLFPSADLASVSHLKMQGDRPLVGHEVVVDFAVSGTAIRRESIALSGQTPTAATSYVLPQFATGGGWLSLVGIVNASGIGQQVTLTAYKEDGSLWPISTNPQRISLNGNAAIRATASDLFGFPADALSTGWIEVKGSVGYLSSYIAYGNTAAPSFAAVAGTDAGQASRFEVFSQVAEGGNFYTGLTLINPGSQDADVEFYTLRADGTTVGRSTFTVKPKERVGKLFSELLPSSLLQVGGWAFVRASQPVVGAVLFGSTNGYSLANVPQQVPAGDFLPPAQTTGAINGSVRASGAPVSDVPIMLSGPVVATTITDSLGRYTFAQLPAGDFKVTPSRPGATFAPSDRAISLNRQNVDGVNFEGGGITSANAPVIQFISPSATYAGNSSFSIRVLGANFTATSVIKVNGQTLATSFVNSAELDAVITASLLTQAGTLKISVETPPPGGGASQAMDFIVNAAPSDPLIEGRGTVGSFPAGVAVDTARNSALVTNQAGDSVTVLDLKTLTAKGGPIAVGRSPAEGIAIHKGKGIALVANPGSNNVSVIDLVSSRTVKEIPVGRFPVGLAVNETTNRAVVANAEDGTLTIINLDSLTAIGQIPVGTRPLGVAIQSRTNQAVVTDSTANSVWIIDLNTNAVLGNIKVGQFPRGVAVNSATNVAVVANANSNDASVIDLSTRAVLFTAKVDVGPTGVAIHEGTNTALITNSAVQRGSTNYSVQSTVSVVDLGVRQVTRAINVGSAAFGIAVDEDGQRAVIANFGSNDVTAIRVPNPKPRVDDVTPKTFPTGGGAFTVTVRGVGFVPSSVVTLNGQALPTTYISYTQLRAEISAAMVDQMLQVRPLALVADTEKGTVSSAVTELQFNISVSNPGPGGGPAPTPDPSVSRIFPQNLQPVLVSISPAEGVAGTSILLSLSGNNFNGTSIINFGGSQFSPTVSTLTSMSVTIPGGFLSPGAVQVSVTNPAPGGGTTPALTFIVSATASGTPIIARVTPPSIQAGSGALTVTVEGSGFAPGATASLDSVQGVVSGNTATFNLTADQTQSPRTLSGLISNPAPGGSAGFSINVLNPAPTISGFNPDTVDAGSSSSNIGVTGTNFRSNSVITVEGTPIPTTFVSPTALSGVIPDTFLASSGEVHIGVTNPAPGGGFVIGAIFRIRGPLPALTSITPPKSAVQTGSLVVKLNGTGFLGNSTVTANGTPLSTLFESRVLLTVTIPASMVAQAGILNIVVQNPAPGGGPSSAFAFAVENPLPVLDSVTPLQFRADQTATVLTVNGRNFVNGATITAGAQTLTTHFVSSTQLTGTFTPPLPLGKQSVKVNNPAPGGGASNGIDIEITALAPTLTSVTPSSVAPGGQIQTVGTNFGPGSTILLRGQPITTTAGSTTQLSGTIPDTAATGSADVIVRNPAGASQPAQDSNAVTITIVNPAPAITGLSPSSAQPGTSVNINGTGFMSTSQVLLNGSLVASTFGNGVLVFTIPLGTPGGAAQVQVTNPPPGGGTSNAATLTVLVSAPTPVISNISPTSGTVGTSVTLTVNGSGFASGATLFFNGTPYTPSASSEAQLMATVNLPSSPGLVPVVVGNPGNVNSNTVFFTVNPVVVPTPTLSGISPPSGAAGATINTVTLTGTNFVANNTTVNAVAGITASGTNVTSPTQLTTTFTISPSATVGGRSVTVTTPNGTSNSVNFSVTAAPQAFTISPNTGTIAGGTRVLITGANFTSANVKVQFGTTYGAGAIRLSSTQIAVFAPPHASGAVSVTVTSGTAQTQANAYTFTSSTLGNAFSTSQPLTIGRSYTTANLLFDGRVIVTGGYSESDVLPSTDVSNATTGVFSAGPTLSIARGYHTATLLADGRLLIVGGYDSSALPLASTEILDAAGTTFSPGPGLTTARAGHTATLLADGRVLVVGGRDGTSQPLGSAEVFDPTTNSWSTITVGAAFVGHQATLLADGRVLVTGDSQTARVFDPAANTFSPLSALMQTDRSYHKALLLPDGRVLLTGGVTSSGVTNSAEIYDGTTFALTPGTTQTPGTDQVAAQLDDGKVLVAGGDSCADSCSASTASIFNPATGTFALSASMAQSRFAASSVRLPNGTILIIGGYGSGARSTTEIFGGAVLPVITSLIPGQRVVNSGSFTLDVLGSNFVSGSQIHFNGTPYSATFVDTQHISAVIPASEISSTACASPPCAFNVKVSIPDPVTPTVFIDSNDATFNVVAAAIALMPNPVNVSVNTTTQVTVAVNQVVTTAAGIDIAVVSDTTGVATVSSPAHIAQGQTTTTVTVTGVSVGSATLTASLAGYLNGTTTVQVASTLQPTVNITPPAIVLNAAGTDTITVSRVNSNNSVSLNVTLAQSRQGYVNIPSTVTIPATQSQIVVPIAGIAPDPTPPVVVTASAPSHLSGTNSLITVQISQIQMTPALLVNPSASANLVITLSSPAPNVVQAPCVAAGLCVTLASNHTNIATVVSPVLIPAGQNQATAAVTGVAGGNATISASAAGYPSVQSQIQVQNVNLSFVPGSATFYSGANYAQSVTLIMSLPAVGGGQVINLSSSDTSVATVPPNVTIPSGSTAVNVTVTGVASGTATITASSPGLTSGTYTATVLSAYAHIDDVEVAISTDTGVRQQHYVSIPSPAPIGGIPVTITSSDSTKLRVAPCNPLNPTSSNCTDTNAPQAAITVSIPTGQTYAYFDVVGQDIAEDEVRLRDPIGVVKDASGNIYIADYGSHVIRKIDAATGIISTFAGNGTNTQTGDNGPANQATVGSPTGLTIYNNELYIACYSHRMVRKINLSTNIITTVVSSNTLGSPYQIAFESSGAMLIADFSTKLYRFTAAGGLVVVAGGGTQPATTVGVQATALSIGSIGGVVTDSQGNIYYTDYNNHLVNQIGPTGTIARVAGNGTCTTSPDTPDGAANGRLCYPTSLAYDAAIRALYIADSYNHRVLRSTLNASEPSATPRPLYRIAGTSNGSVACCGDGLPSRLSALYYPDGLSVDSSGNLLIGDRYHYRVRQITQATGIIDTVAGGGVAGYSGDGQRALSNHLIVSAPSFATQHMAVDINQSVWTFQNATNFSTVTVGVPFSVVVRANNTSDRMATATNVNLSSLAGGLFSITSTPVTIPLNGSSATFTVTAATNGTGQLRADANISGPNTRFGAAITPTITALPVPTPPLTIDDSYGTQDTASGARRAHFVRLPSAAGAGGVPVQLTIQGGSAAQVSKCNTTNAASGTCDGLGAVGSTATVTVPQGGNYAYFDLIGGSTGLSESRLYYPTGVAVATNGDVYVADYSNYRVRKLSGGVLSTVAGTGSSTSTMGGTAATTSLRPIGLATDASGNLYVATENAHVIYQITPGGAIAVVAGTLNSAGSANGLPSTSTPAGQLNSPWQVAIGNDGSIYIADYNNHRIRKVQSTSPPAVPTNGSMTTIAGGGGTTPADGVAATSATFGNIGGVAVDPVTNEVYFSDYTNHKVWKFSQSNGQLVLVAGTGTGGYNGDQADATQALLYYPAHLSIQGSSLYIADEYNHRIRKVTTTGSPRTLVTVAGTTSAGFNGDEDPAIISRLYYPYGVATDAAGNIYIGDQYNHRVRKVLASNTTIQTIIGNGNYGFAGDGGSGRGTTVKATAAGFLPVEVGIDVQQSQWQIISLVTTQTTSSTFPFTVRSSSNDRMAANTTFNMVSTAPAVFTVPAQGTINNNQSSVGVTATTLAAGGNGQIAIQATGSGPTFTATTSPVITVLPPATPPLTIDDSFGPQDTGSGVRRGHFVRLPTTAAGGVPVQLTVQGGTSAQISLCNTTSATSSTCDGLSAAGSSVSVTVPSGQNYAYFDLIGGSTATAESRLYYPAGVAVDSSSGAIYVADYSNYRVRKLSGGTLSTIAGTGSSTSSLGGTALTTGLRPIGLATDASGNVYIATDNAHVIYQITPAGAITVVAGTYNSAGSANGLPSSTTSSPGGQLNTPWQVAIGSDGSIYIADYNNHRIRKVQSTSPPAVPTNGSMTTIAGGGSTTPADGVAANSASLGNIGGVAVDPVTNEVYFSDYTNHKVWKFSQSNGQLVLIAGTGTGSYNGDQADATQAQLYYPAHLSIQGSSLYIADEYNHRIRKVTTTGAPRALVTVAGTTNAGFNGDGDPAIISRLYYPFGVAADASGNIYIGDQYNHRVREVPSSNSTMQTIIGNGTNGFAGDGGSGRGTTVKATAAGFLPVEVGVDVQQSQWSFSGPGSAQTTSSTFTFTVRTPSGDRMAANTTFGMVSTSPSVFTVPAQGTINNNQTGVVITATTSAGGGTGQVQIPPTGSAPTFTGATSVVITVLPPATPALLIDDSFGPEQTATGSRQAHFVRLPVAATGSPVSVNIMSSDASRVGLSLCDPANSQTSACTGTSPTGAGITVTVPVNSTYAYFDLIGLTSFTPDTRVYYPTGVGVDPNGAVYVADYSNYRIRKLAGGVLSTIAGTGSSSPSLGSTALTTSLRPLGVTADSAGNVYATSDNGHVVYQITPAGGISVIAGTQNTAGSADGIPSTGRLNSPWQVTIGPDGSIYIADYNNHRVRKIPSTSPPAIPLNGNMITIAGGGSTAPANGVVATNANLGDISGVAVDPATNDVYFSEYDAHRVWKFSQSNGQLVLIAGTGTSGYNGDFADATQAQLSYPAHLSISGGMLIIADEYNHRIRRVTMAGSPRQILTVAGSTQAGFNGDGDLAIVERLYYPLGVATDSTGNIYIADQYNHRIREVLASNSTMQTIIGSGTAGYSGDGLPGRGVTITASIAPGGPTYLPITIGADVEQSSWVFSSYPTSTNDVFNFTVRQTSPGSSSLRMNSATTFSLTPTAQSTITLPATLTINNNATSVQGTATTIGAGITQIIAQASSTGIALGATSNITVTPFFSSVAPNNGPQNTTTPVTITGRNFLGTTAITTTATGVSVTGIVVSADGKTITANIVVGAGATAGAKTLTINTATGNPTFTFTVN